MNDAAESDRLSVAISACIIIVAIVVAAIIVHVANTLDNPFSVMLSHCKISCVGC